MGTHFDRLSNDNSLVRAIHTAVKGRARYKVSGLYHSKALKKYLEFSLPKEKGIEQVFANDFTGNVLVIFHPDFRPNAISLLIQGIVLDYRKQTRKLSVRTAYISTAQAEAKFLPINRIKLNELAAHAQEQKILPWHVLEADSVIAEFNTSAVSGLSSASAQENLKQYGPNVLPEAACPSKVSTFIEQFKSLPVAFLSVAAGLSIATGGLANALVIMGVVITNAVIGYTTESQSEKIINSPKNLVKPSALVIRNGNLQQISAEEIVAGDILVLQLGNYIAADARLIEANRFSIDESSLFGESLPVVKTTQALTMQDVPLGKRVNMVYMGTLVTGGQGIGVVVATGKNTVRGKIQTRVGEAILPETPMQKQLGQADNQLVLVSGAVCALIFCTGLLHTYGLDKGILLAIQKLHTPLLDRIMLGITFLGEPVVLLLICLGLEIGPLYNHRRLEVSTLGLAAVGAIGLNYVLKVRFGRARPALWKWIVDVGHYSFPSGHAMISIVIYGFIAYILAKQFPQWRGQIFALAVVLIVSIGLSRLYLGVHWPTDVAAGYAAGLVWLIVCILSLELWQKYCSSGRHSWLPDRSA
jgi:membrane-associated phospholipid phosphatase